MTTKEQRDVALALKRMREAFYDNYNELNVEGIIEAIEEYVTARLQPAAPYDPRLTEEYEAARLRQPPQGRSE
jgi:predicted  nucleic acid-binding Zn-ribbon protein